MDTELKLSSIELFFQLSKSILRKTKSSMLIITMPSKKHSTSLLLGSKESFSLYSPILKLPLKKHRLFHLYLARCQFL
jgi:hypothetical protein